MSRTRGRSHPIRMDFRIAVAEMILAERRDAGNMVQIRNTKGHLETAWHDWPEKYLLELEKKNRHANEQAGYLICRGWF